MTTGRRARGTDPAELVQALLALGERVAEALEASDPAAATRCAGWTVRALDRHLGAVVGGLADLLLRPSAAPADTGLNGWAAALPALAATLDAEAHSAGPGLREGLEALRRAWPRADRAGVVEQRTGRSTVADAVTFRLVELVVHGRDVPRPFGPVDPPAAALRPVVRGLAQVLAQRAPGRHVELRVPPFTAVQCVQGPRHTRGTPPNVAEVDPVAFVELCAGRLSWHEAAADGRVRTWGDRADISAWLPLLG